MLDFVTNGIIERYKAIIVPKGFKQTKEWGYNATITQVIKMKIVILILSISSSQNRFLHQLNIINVFLHGDLYEYVYMKWTLGFNIYHENLVYEHNGSIYGLKQDNR